jgi:hypothetical protein
MDMRHPGLHRRIALPWSIAEAEGRAQFDADTAAGNPNIEPLAEIVLKRFCLLSGDLLGQLKNINAHNAPYQFIMVSLCVIHDVIYGSYYSSVKN